METSYIARFSKDGEELEVLGGISNHMDGSFDRKYFAGDRCYPDFAPNVYLYKRGDKNPIATFENIAGRIHHMETSGTSKSVVFA